MIDTTIEDIFESGDPSYVASIQHNSVISTSRGITKLHGVISLNPPNGETYEEISNDPSIVSAMVIAWIQTFQEHV
tara:strand:+ start:338 stop:565 length:228 start_codon:yes stop_codon:yes gene_type:complete